MKYQAEIMEAFEARVRSRRPALHHLDGSVPIEKPPLDDKTMCEISQHQKNLLMLGAFNQARRDIGIKGSSPRTCIEIPDDDGDIVRSESCTNKAHQHSPNLPPPSAFPPYLPRLPSQQQPNVVDHRLQPPANIHNRPPDVLEESRHLNDFDKRTSDSFQMMRRMLRSQVPPRRQDANDRHTSGQPPMEQLEPPPR